MTRYYKGDVVKHLGIVYLVTDDFESDDQFTEYDLVHYLEVYTPTITLVGKTGGQQTIDAGSLIRQGKIWLNPGISSATDGAGILAADTIQVNFLRNL
jgi:hypothetical protein